MRRRAGRSGIVRTDQMPDDVLILKFADTLSERDSKVASMCAHCSPVVHGVREEEEPRMSVEARVMAFWS